MTPTNEGLAITIQRLLLQHRAAISRHMVIHKEWLSIGLRGRPLWHSPVVVLAQFFFFFFYFLFSFLLSAYGHIWFKPWKYPEEFFNLS
jgi:hypothetical protein